ncbi:MAG: 2-iminoacetate synthase ThiH [Spirochaetes bacterium]|nr:2-iminoacetate synthase ThiH [Spirochaetota bacterium]
MKITELINNYSYADILKKIDNNNNEDKILSILQKDKIEFSDFLSLLSDKALNILPSIVQKSRDVTLKRFGKVISFYVPIYLSNECLNQCIYCGFNAKRQIIRKTLDINEIDKEFIKLKNTGFDNVLLLTGEDNNKAGLDYLKEAVNLAKTYFTFVGLEVYPMETEEYKELLNIGVDGLTIYQETYDKTTYDAMHPSGKKKDYDRRLTTPDRACMAGFRKVGIGALLGLFDWKYEAAMIALHLNYLQKTYWKTEFTLGFPRINPPASDFKIPYPVQDKYFIQLISALRLYLPEVGFLLTTREKPELRNNLIGLMITQVSAGSKTSPGGYLDNSSDEQFHVSDTRELKKMIEVVKSKGYEAVIKDWEKNFASIK